MQRTKQSTFYRSELSERYQITTQRDLRGAFWEAHPNLQRRGNSTQNDYPADTRMAWVDYVDHMARDGIISEALAQRATL